MIIYPKSFKNKVLNIFSNHAKLKTWLDEGNPQASYFLAKKLDQCEEVARITRELFIESLVYTRGERRKEKREN